MFFSFLSDSLFFYFLLFSAYFSGEFINGLSSLYLKQFKIMFYDYYRTKDFEALNALFS